MSTYKILTQNLKKIVTQNGLFRLIYKRTGNDVDCKYQYYRTEVTGFLVTGQTISEITGEITYEGEMVTYNTPKPKWTDGENNNVNQCNSVELGGFNGLNS